MGIVFIVVAIVVVIAVIYIVVFNNLVTLKNRVDNAFSQIDVQMQRRCDLIPNLVETVKGYAKHEKKTLEAVTASRTNWQNAATTKDKINANNQISDALKSLFAVSEAYPDLKANESFLDLQNQLAETEDKISYMRQSYNDCVMALNTKIQQFPSSIVAKLGKFKLGTFFESTSESKKPVEVKF